MATKKKRRVKRVKLLPADYVIHVFQGVRSTARAIGLVPSAISRWRHDYGGRVPGRSQLLILEAAKKSNLDITPHDIIYGRVITKKK